MNYCRVCGVNVDENKKNRHPLSGKDVLSTLTEFAKCALRTTPLGSQRCEPQLNYSEFESGYVCKSCYRDLVKVQTLDNQLSDLKSSIASKVSESIRANPTIISYTRQEVPVSDNQSPQTHREVPESAHQSPSTSRKRVHSGKQSSTEFSKRRRLLRAVEHIPTTSKNSPDVAVTVLYKKSRPRSYVLTPRRRQICRPLARGSRCAFARRCLRDHGIRRYIVKGLGASLRREIAGLCSDSTTSVLRHKSTCILKEFTWEKLLTEVKEIAPTLFEFLRSCTQTRKPRKNRDAIVGVLVAIMCKHRRPVSSLLQQLTSLVLYSGHASKRVYDRLQKVGVCMSHSRTIALVDKLGVGFDDKVLEWKADVEHSMDSTTLANRNASLLIGDQSETLEDSNSQSSRSLSPVLSDSAEHSSGYPLPTSPVKVKFTSDNVLSSDSDRDGSSPPLASSTSLDSASVTPDLGSVSTNSSTVSQPQPDVTSSPPHVPERNGTSLTSQPAPTPSPCSGYKFVIDNIDTGVKPRYQRIDSQNQSLHYVQVFAVKDRLDFSQLSSTPPLPGRSVYELLPSTMDYQMLKEHFTILVARVLVEHIPYFAEDFKGLVINHIPHPYTSEMAKKSEVVPLGVLPHSEINYEDVIKVLEIVQGYAPSIDVERELVVPDQSGGATTIRLEDKQYAVTLVGGGGDQLTVARIRGAQKIRGNSETSEQRFDGLLPVAEDWHAKMCLLEVIWKRLYKPKSGMERGTLYQLRNLINRRNVTKSVKSDMNACEDFFEVVVTGHIIASAMELLGMSSIDDVPSSTIIESPEELWMKDDSERKAIIMEVASTIVDQNVDLSTKFAESQTQMPTSACTDNVNAYSCETLSLGLLFMEFKDAIREGDGDRVLLVWKYLFLLFKASGRRNYSIEAFTLLSQYHLILPERLAEQLKWSRFINTHGHAGHNISCDLHMEHLNKLAKVAVQGLGANKTEKAIQRVGRGIGTMADAMDTFDAVNNVPSVSGAHSKKSSEKDLKKIVSQLVKSSVFDIWPGRKHKSFPHLKTNYIRSLSEKDLKQWMLDHYATTVLR